jgi:hypothetical protein
MNLSSFLQLIGTIFAFVALVITIIKMWSTFIRELTQLQQCVLTHEDIMKEHIRKSEADFERIEKHELMVEKEMYEELEKVRNSNIKETKELLSKFEQSLSQLSKESRQDHKEVVDRIDTLSIKVTQICATFDEYRKNRNSGRPRK